jgi:pimeloyl-ACP methyl ester carboxylesterase
MAEDLLERCSRRRPEPGTPSFRERRIQFHTSIRSTTTSARHLPLGKRRQVTDNSEGSQVVGVDHGEKVVRDLDAPPLLIGHSVGGLLAQRLLGVGLARAAVALAPLPVGGLSLDSSQTRPWSLLPAEPAEEHRSLVTLPTSQFRCTVANAVGEEEAARVFELYAVPAPRRLFADLEPARVADTVVNTANPERGPLLFVSGQEDRMVPDAV